MGFSPSGNINWEGLIHHFIGEIREATDKKNWGFRAWFLGRRTIHLKSMWGFILDFSLKRCLAPGWKWMEKENSHKTFSSNNFPFHNALNWIKGGFCATIPLYSLQILGAEEREFPLWMAKKKLSLYSITLKNLSILLFSLVYIVNELKNPHLLQIEKS